MISPAKKEGAEMPTTEPRMALTSQKVSFFTAASIPSRMPITVAKIMADNARTIVPGIASASTSHTSRLVWYERPKYGFFQTSAWSEPKFINEVYWYLAWFTESRSCTVSGSISFR
ncbi:hypothetical protein D3C72_641380 [compost metagenome]